MEYLIEQSHLDAAIGAGACESNLRRYRAGMQVVDVHQTDAGWVECNLPTTAAAIRLEIGVPFWAIVRSGSGYGKGYGVCINYGHGDGISDGYGDDYGDGSGCIDGCNYGYDYGDGCGCGDGCNHGYDYSDGGGCGDGDSDDYGDGGGRGDGGGG